MRDKSGHSFPKYHYHNGRPQRKRRMEWGRSKLHWNTNKWAHVVFSDKSMFRTFSYSSSNRIRRCNNEILSPICPSSRLGVFSRFDVGILNRIRGNTNSTIYQEVLLNDRDQIIHNPLCKIIFYLTLMSITEMFFIYQ